MEHNNLNFINIYSFHLNFRLYCKPYSLLHLLLCKRGRSFSLHCAENSIAVSIALTKNLVVLILVSFNIFGYSMSTNYYYHLGFGHSDVADHNPTIAIISGDPERARRIAQEQENVQFVKTLSENRGLHSYLATLANGMPFISATTGMGAPSTSIVMNELHQLGIRHVVRVGTSGSIQPDVAIGSVVISRAVLCWQGAADDMAPKEYPSSANPFLTSALVDAAEKMGCDWHIGLTASTDTFYEGQERTDISANKYLLRQVAGQTEEYRHLNILNYEMEAGTLFKMANVYGFSAACICAIIANRTQSENPSLAQKKITEENAIQITLAALENLPSKYFTAKYYR